MPRNLKILLAYDGTEYHGWERQPRDRSLQQTLEEAVHSLTGQPVRVVASGRTDAGVHALGQVANFRTEATYDCATIQKALNALLPQDIRVLDVADAAEDFHANYSAKGKMYRYVMCDRAVMDPFLRRYVVHCQRQLDHALMQEAAQCLVGTHDFSSFETAGAPRSSSVRTIRWIQVFRDSPLRIWQSGESTGSFQASASDAGCSALLFLEIAADGFLYNMVRSIAGTLMNVGRGFWPATHVRMILESQDRTRAGPTAPAHGLFLVHLYY